MPLIASPLNQTAAGFSLATLCFPNRIDFSHLMIIHDFTMYENVLRDLFASRIVTNQCECKYGNHFSRYFEGLVSPFPDYLSRTYGWVVRQDE
jgi:hypothetical protein